MAEFTYRMARSWVLLCVALLGIGILSACDSRPRQVRNIARSARSEDGLSAIDALQKLRDLGFRVEHDSDMERRVIGPSDDVGERIGWWPPPDRILDADVDASSYCHPDTMRWYFARHGTENPFTPTIYLFVGVDEKCLVRQMFYKERNEGWP